MRTVTRRVSVPWGDVAGWKSCSMSTGQRAMWAMGRPTSATASRPGPRRSWDARDDSGRVVVWQDLRYTLGGVGGTR